MWHSNRSWSLQTIDSRERLAFKLAHLTWTSCQAFQVDGYIFANDSTGPDGAQAPRPIPFGVGSISHGKQVEWIAK